MPWSVPWIGTRQVYRNSGLILCLQLLTRLDWANPSARQFLRVTTKLMSWVPSLCLHWVYTAHQSTRLTSRQQFVMDSILRRYSGELLRRHKPPINIAHSCPGYCVMMSLLTHCVIGQVLRFTLGKRVMSAKYNQFLMTWKKKAFSFILWL